MNRLEARNELEGVRGFFRHWMGYSQRLALLNALRGEEGDHFATMLGELKARIEAMPKPYATEEVDCPDKIVHLHYFGGPIDIHVVERDSSDEQLQAFGYVNMGDDDCAEWGYVSIQEAIDAGVELDLYWTPKAFKEVSK